MLYLTRKFGFALKHETQSWRCLCNFKSSSGSLPPLLGVSQGFIRRTWQCAVPSAPECTGTRVKAVQQQNLVFLHSCILWFWNLSNIKIIGLWQMCISTLRYMCLILPVSMDALSHRSARGRSALKLAVNMGLNSEASTYTSCKEVQLE